MRQKLNFQDDVARSPLNLRKAENPNRALNFLHEPIKMMLYITVNPLRDDSFLWSCFQIKVSLVHVLPNGTLFDPR